MLLDIKQTSKAEFYNKLSVMIRKNTRHHQVGFWGQPDQVTMDLFAASQFNFIDLDIPRDLTKAADYNPSSNYTPQTTCHIIQDIINNAFSLSDQLDFIIATTDRDKCEQGSNAAVILTQEGLPVILASNDRFEPLRPSLLSNAAAPLAQRVNRIMELTYKPLSEDEQMFYSRRQIQEPEFIFHGVPPRDLSLLNHFPDNTRIEGWTKLVELGIPSRIDLEWLINRDIPTVFFTQSFCHKELLAAYWAKKIGGLHIEAHGSITNSTEAKLQAYLGLAGKTFLKGGHL